MPGDWTSVSTMPTRFPFERRQHREVGGDVRLAGAAAERVDRDDLRHQGSCSSSAALAQLPGLLLKHLEVVGVGDLGDLARALGLVDLDVQLADLAAGGALRAA